MLFLLVACAPPPLPVGDQTPSIKITWPPPESDVTGCEIVTVRVDNFRLVEFPSTDENADGEGHYHIEYPGDYTACYKPYCLVDLSAAPASAAPYFIAYLANTDHTEVLIDNNRVEHQIPINFIPGGDCGSGGEETGG